MKGSQQQLSRICTHTKRKGFNFLKRRKKFDFMIPVDVSVVLMVSASLLVVLKNMFVFGLIVPKRVILLLFAVKFPALEA